MSLRTVSWTDEEGRMWATLLPSDAPDKDARYGIPAGPSPLGDLGLPLAVEVRLHNELFHRRLLSARDLQKRPQDLMGALMAAFRVDADRIRQLFSAPGGNKNDQGQAPEDRTEPSLAHRGPRRTR